MVSPLLSAYLASALVLAASPGATTAVVIRATLERGRSAGVAAALGAAAGNTLQGVAAILGLGPLLERWPALLTAVRVAGALYLVWLGLAGLRRAAGRARAADRAVGPSPGPRRSAFREGLVVNATSPFIMSFYLVVVPTFVPAGSGGALYPALIAAHVAIAFGCHLAWSAAFALLGAMPAGGRPRRALEAAAALVLLAFAARIVATL